MFTVDSFTEFNVVKSWLLTVGKNLTALSVNGFKMTSVCYPLNVNELNVFKKLKL
jgi:hypothetical protein